MIVWIASYPRSGNTFFRILFHHFTKLPTYHLYTENDSEIDLKRGELTGHKKCPFSLEEMKSSADIFFIKTHELPPDQSPAIYIVRDGRDAYVSYLRYVQNYEKEFIKGKTDTQIFNDLIAGTTSFGGWSNNVMAWIQRSAPTVVLRFEYLVSHSDPRAIIEYAMQELGLHYPLIEGNESLPTLQQLNDAEPTFFRSGKVGRWKTEMPPDIQDIFWRYHGYAMHKMGYPQEDAFSQEKLDLSDASSLKDDHEYIKEQTIQNPSFIRKLYPASWRKLSARALLKKIVIKVLSSQLLAAIRRRRSYPLDLKPQFEPRPIRLPAHYYQSSLDTSRLDTLPVVSIVTPSYNQAQFIEQTIESVLAQDYPKLEYIIQDGASNDGTAEILGRYSGKVKAIHSTPDTGQSQAINRGFQHSTGEIMAWLNSDDLLLPGTVSYVAQYFAEHPEVNAVYGHRMLIDEAGLEFGHWVMPPHEDEILRWADYVPQETLFWRRSLWDKTGGWINESYRSAMDWELLARFLSVRANFVRLPRFLGAFRVHDLQKTQAIVSVGEEEMYRLRYWLHGRAVLPSEVGVRIAKYLERATQYLSEFEHEV